MKIQASLSNIILDIYKNIIPEKEYTDLTKTDFSIVYSNKYHTNCIVLNFIRLLGKPSTVVTRDYRLFKKDIKKVYNEKIEEWLKNLIKTKKVVVYDNYIGIELLPKKYSFYLEAKVIKNSSDYINYSNNLDTCYSALDNKHIKFFPTQHLLDLQKIILQQIAVFNSDTYWLKLLESSVK